MDNDTAKSVAALIGYALFIALFVAGWVAIAQMIER